MAASHSRKSRGCGVSDAAQSDDRVLSGGRPDRCHRKKQQLDLSSSALAGPVEISRKARGEQQGNFAFPGLRKRIVMQTASNMHICSVTNKTGIFPRQKKNLNIDWGKPRTEMSMAACEHMQHTLANRAVFRQGA